MNPVQQYEQSITTLNTPAVVRAFRTNPMAPVPQAIYNVTTPSATTTTTVPTAPTLASGISSLFSGPGLVIGLFGISLMAAVAGSGAVRTLGVIGMVAAPVAFLIGVSQIH